MIKYIAFLRGINVSGHRIIKMEELRKIFEALKFKNVKTYIQSGNVVFEAKEKDSQALTGKIEKHLLKSLGYEVEVMIRTIPEMEDIIKNNPFRKTKFGENVYLYLTILHEEPTNELKKFFITFSDDIATFKIREREVYTLYNKNNAKHPFSNNFVEKKLKMTATTRNWNVINKVLDFAKE